MYNTLKQITLVHGVSGKEHRVANTIKDSKMFIAAHCMQTVVMIFGLFAIDLPAEYFGICFIIHSLLPLLPRKLKAPESCLWISVGIW